MMRTDPSSTWSRRVALFRNCVSGFPFESLMGYRYQANVSNITIPTNSQNIQICRP